MKAGMNVLLGEFTLIDQEKKGAHFLCTVFVIHWTELVATFAVQHVCFEVSDVHPPLPLRDYFSGTLTHRLSHN